MKLFFIVMFITFLSNSSFAQNSNSHVRVIINNRVSSKLPPGIVRIKDGISFNKSFTVKKIDDNTYQFSNAKAKKNNGGVTGTAKCKCSVGKSGSCPPPEKTDGGSSIRCTPGSCNCEMEVTINRSGVLMH